MKITSTNLFTVIEADEGKILIEKSTGYGATTIYLGIYDSPDNYTEIPADEYVEPEPEEPEPEEPSDESAEEMIQRIFNEEINR